ncbi:MAG: hypothetical protein ACE5JL_14305 [Dehalococcoidia bacterium]
MTPRKNKTSRWGRSTISLLAVLSGRRFSASRIRRDGAKGAIVHLTREDPKRQRLERRQDKTQLSEVCKL